MPKITEKTLNNKNNKILVDQFDNLVNQIKHDISKETDKIQSNRRLQLQSLDHWLIFKQIMRYNAAKSEVIVNGKF